MPSPSTQTVGRFAPSPTGALHMGNLRTALASWLWARAQGGQWLIRMEDVDQPRCKQTWADQQLQDLAILGLTSDLPVVYQSQRSAFYQAALDHLWEQGRLYPCRCTRKELAQLASAPHQEDGLSPYPGTCRAHQGQTDPSQALRFRLQEGKVQWQDRVWGDQQDDPTQLTGDPLLHRRDGFFAYHLAVVVDDGLQGVTDIVRGMDLKSVTATQIQIRQALQGFFRQRAAQGLPPTYAHLDLVSLGGQRLGKRHGALSLTALAAMGITPQQVLGWLGYSLGCQDTPAPCEAASLVKGFSWKATHQPHRLAALSDWLAGLPDAAGSSPPGSLDKN